MAYDDGPFFDQHRTSRLRVSFRQLDGLDVPLRFLSRQHTNNIKIRLLFPSAELLYSLFVNNIFSMT